MKKRLESDGTTLLQLRDYEEIVGKLIAIYTDGAVITIHGQSIKVFLAAEEILQKLRKFLGHKIGILRVGGHYYIRKVKVDYHSNKVSNSVSETIINSKETGMMYISKSGYADGSRKSVFRR